MNEIRIKLRSEKGASISFALLLFLVCAVTGSVILAAATAAAGRLSRLVESDQRYYSVTSAAKMLKADLDNKTVQVVRTEISETTKTYDYNDKEIDSSEDNNKDPAVITIDGKVVDNSYKPDSILAYAAYIMMGLSSSNQFPDFTIEASGGGESSYPALDVLVHVTLEEDGTISLVLKSGDGSSDRDVFSMKMNLQVDQTQKTDVRTETGTPKEVDARSYQITTKQTKITTTDYTWKLTGIETIVSGS